MITSNVCAVESEQHPWPESTVKVGWCWLFSLIVKLLLIVGLVLSRKKILQFPTKLWAGIELIDKFAEAVDSFIERFEVERGNASMVHSVLFNCLYEDAPLKSSDDPEERVKTFFAKIDADILDLSSKFS